jgi:hypothetical protein
MPHATIDLSKTAACSKLLADLSNTVFSATRQTVSTQQDSVILHFDGYQWRVQDFLPDVAL